MSTWTSRIAAAGLLAAALSGCDAATGLPFAADLGALSEAPGRARMVTVSLAGGAVILSAPEGYCIDRRTLHRTPKAGFAVMARCDTLGVRGFFGAHDLAIITVTTAPQAPGSAAPDTEAVARSADGAEVLDRQSRDGLSLIRFGQGAHGLEGVSPVHWRGAFALNGHLVGVGLYAPEGSAVLREDGARLLRDLTSRTRAASTDQTAAE